MDVCYCPRNVRDFDLLQLVLNQPPLTGRYKSAEVGRMSCVLLLWRCSDQNRPGIGSGLLSLLRLTRFQHSWLENTQTIYWQMA